MNGQPELGGHFLRLLVGGFALLVLLLIASGYAAISALQSADSSAGRLLEEQRAAMRLLGDVQRDEESLSSVFYALAAHPGATERRQMLARLEAEQASIVRATDAGLKSAGGATWRRVRQAADAFAAEGRLTLETGQPPSAAFFRTHEQLVTSVADLATESVESSARNAIHEADRARTRARHSISLLAGAVLVACAAAGLTVYFVNRMFARLRWQAAELSNLSSRSMSEHEAVARRLSHELHDHFGQTLNAIQANLVAMHHTGQYKAARIEDCLALTGDAIDNVREVSQLLRPSMLDDFGLDASLRWLTTGFSERTGIGIEYQSTFTGRLTDETETQLFRIAQEALTNVARHAKAECVQVNLDRKGEVIELSIADDGKGFSPGPARNGMGLVGMRARARMAHASITIESGGHGVQIRVILPLPKEHNVSPDSHSLSG
jgi:signal transduction histidine kinase